MVRNIVKKYKKTARNIGVNKRLGEARGVSEKEYRINYSVMIERCGDKLVIMPETIPRHETSRNPAIKQYNRLIENIASSRDTCIVIKLFDDFLANMNGFYLDMGHPNEIGYEHIADKILEALECVNYLRIASKKEHQKERQPVKIMGS